VYREYRKGSSTRHIFTTNAVCSSFQKHAPTVSASRKRQKTTPVTTSLPPHVLPCTVHTLLEAAGKGVPGGVGGRKSKVVSIIVSASTLSYFYILASLPLLRFLLLGVYLMINADSILPMQEEG
jgi:hypothetical protein